MPSPERVGGSGMSECTFLREGRFGKIEHLTRQALAFACGEALFRHWALSGPDSGMIAASVVGLFLKAHARKTH